MVENTGIDTVIDDDLADEAFDERQGGKAYSAGGCLTNR